MKFEPGDKFKDVAESFVKTFSDYGFGDMAQEGFEVNASYKTSENCKEKISNFLKKKDGDSQDFFKSVLDKSQI